MVLSRKRGNFDILSTKLKKLVIENEQKKEDEPMEEVKLDKDTPMGKTIDKLTKGSGCMRGRKKKEKLIDGHALLTA
jgi:hypothetical protein